MQLDTRLDHSRPSFSNDCLRDDHVLTTVLLRDVTMRDGLQDEQRIATSDKLRLFEALVGAGVRDLELVSFVRADRVPAMADAEQMAAATAKSEPPVTRWGLVLNERGAERALAAGIRHLQWVISVSERHQLHNAGQTVAEGVAGLGRIVEVANRKSAEVELTIATAFGCPYAGPVDPGAVLRLVESAADAGAAGIGLADTIGTGLPSEVGPLVRRATALGLPVGAHFHDTRGLAIANALAAIDAGAVRIDGSVGGLGGCPFAPGASGNLALEDLAHALDQMGVNTGIDVECLIDVAHLACELTGRHITSHVGLAGPRFRSMSDPED